MESDNFPLQIASLLQSLTIQQLPAKKPARGSVRPFSKAKKGVTGHLRWWLGTSWMGTKHRHGPRWPQVCQLLRRPWRPPLQAAVTLPPPDNQLLKLPFPGVGARLERSQHTTPFLPAQRGPNAPRAPCNFNFPLLLKVKLTHPCG